MNEHGIAGIPPGFAYPYLSFVSSPFLLWLFRVTSCTVVELLKEFRLLESLVLLWIPES